MIVVDTSILLKLWLPAADTEDVGRLWQLDADWAVPLLWRSELCSALAGYLRAGKLSSAQARYVAMRLEELVQSREFAVPTTGVLDLVEASVCSAHDCEFVALALELGVPLVTSAQQVLREFAGVARTVRAHLRSAKRR